MQFLDKYGWPVERIKGRPVRNMIRLLLWTRKIKKGQWVGKTVRQEDLETLSGPQNRASSNS